MDEVKSDKPEDPAFLYSVYNFYYKRTCFRTMNLYFKNAFQPYYNTWKKNNMFSTNQTKIEDALTEFTNDYFVGLFVDVPSESAQAEFIYHLKLLIFSHRHLKNDDFLNLDEPLK